MNTQLTKILLLLTITAGFASAQTIQEPIAEPDQANISESFSIAKVDFYSGQVICDQLIASPTWGSTIKIAMAMPEHEPIKFFGKEEYGAFYSKYPNWSEDYKSKVDHEELGFKKFFSESPYCTKEVADNANYALNYWLSEIKDNLNNIRPLKLSADQDRESRLGRMDAYTYLDNLKDGLWKIELVIRDFEGEATAPVPLDAYKAFIPTITQADIKNIGTGKESDRYYRLLELLGDEKRFLSNMTTVKLVFRD